MGKKNKKNSIKLCLTFCQQLCDEFVNDKTVMQCKFNMLINQTRG